MRQGSVRVALPQFSREEAMDGRRLSLFFTADLSMTFIKPDDPDHRYRILSNLAENVGRRMGFQLGPFDATAVQDASGTLHWMYVFDEHESRIYRVQNGRQEMADIELDDEKFIDLDQTADRIRNAIEKLILKNS